MQVHEFKYVQYISWSELLGETKEFIRDLEISKPDGGLVLSLLQIRLHTANWVESCLLRPPQVMLAGSAYAVSPTVVLQLCL